MREREIFDFGGKAERREGILAGSAYGGSGGNVSGGDGGALTVCIVRSLYIFTMQNDQVRTRDTM